VFFSRGEQLLSARPLSVIELGGAGEPALASDTCGPLNPGPAWNADRRASKQRSLECPNGPELLRREHQPRDQRCRLFLHRRDGV
jgi:hypothetical protein